MSEFITLDLSLENPAFYPLGTTRSDNQWQPIPNKAFPAELKYQVSSVYSALFDADLPEDGVTVLARYEEGKLSRLYGPAVYLNANASGFVIKWGDEVLPLNMVSKKFYPENLDDCELEIAEAVVGRYTDICLQGAVEANDGSVIVFGFPIKLLDYKAEVSAKGLNMKLGKGFENIASLFRYIPDSSSSSGSNSDGPVRLVKNLFPGTYDIDGWKGVKNNTKYIVNLKDVTYTEESGEIVELSEANFWAPAKLITAISSGLKSDKGATFSIVPLDEDGDRRRYDIEGEYDFDNSTALDLSFLS